MVGAAGLEEVFGRLSKGVVGADPLYDHGKERYQVEWILTKPIQSL